MKTQPVVFIVEDEDDIALLLNFSLTKAGYSVEWVKSLTQAKKRLQESLPDIMLLDWMLPDGDGARWLRQLREESRTASLPVLMLTARALEDDKVMGLDCGADDYITKPFSPKELLARLKTILRRTAPQLTQEDICFGDCRLREEDRSLWCGSQRVAISSAEYKLLKFFLTHPNKIYSRNQLLDMVWGDHVFIEERTVDVHVLRLRKILRQVQLEQPLETVRSLGYRWNTQLSA